MTLTSSLRTRKLVATKHHIYGKHESRNPRGPLPPAYFKTGHRLDSQGPMSTGSPGFFRGRLHQDRDWGIQERGVKVTGCYEVRAGVYRLDFNIRAIFLSRISWCLKKTIQTEFPKPLLATTTVAPCPSAIQWARSSLSVSRIRALGRNARFKCT